MRQTSSTWPSWGDANLWRNAAPAPEPGGGRGRDAGHFALPAAAAPTRPPAGAYRSVADVPAPGVAPRASWAAATVRPRRPMCATTSLVLVCAMASSAATSPWRSAIMRSPTANTPVRVLAVRCRQLMMFVQCLPASRTLPDLSRRPRRAVSRRRRGPAVAIGFGPLVRFGLRRPVEHAGNRHRQRHGTGADQHGGDRIECPDHAPLAIETRGDPGGNLAIDGLEIRRRGPCA